MAWSTREMLVGDVAAAAKVHALCFPDSWSAELIEFSLAQRDTLSLSAESASGELIAFAFVQSSDTYASILSISIAPEWQDRGVGTEILGVIAGSIAVWGVEKLVLEAAVDNAAALALYERAGFKPIERLSEYYTIGRDDPVDAIRMVKLL